MNHPKIMFDYSPPNATTARCLSAFLENVHLSLQVHVTRAERVRSFHKTQMSIHLEYVKGKAKWPFPR